MSFSESIADMQNGMQIHPVICAFYIRTPSKDGKWHYDRLTVRNREGDGNMRTFHPPMVGDTLPLKDGERLGARIFKVIHRDWMTSSYGSVNWPITHQAPVVGSTLQLIVEPCEGPFVNESDLKSPYDHDED